MSIGVGEDGGDGSGDVNEDDGDGPGDVDEDEVTVSTSVESVEMTPELPVQGPDTGMIESAGPACWFMKPNGKMVESVLDAVRVLPHLMWRLGRSSSRCGM